MKLTTMIGAGLGAMYLGNEGKGETFTSYPNPSRIKQILGSKINKPETYPGSGQNIYGQKIVIGMGAGSISSWMRDLPKLL